MLPYYHSTLCTESAPRYHPRSGSFVFLDFVKSFNVGNVIIPSLLEQMQFLYRRSGVSKLPNSHCRLPTSNAPDSKRHICTTVGGDWKLQILSLVNPFLADPRHETLQGGELAIQRER